MPKRLVLSPRPAQRSPAGGGHDVTVENPHGLAGGRNTNRPYCWRSGWKNRTRAMPPIWQCWYDSN